MLNSATGGAAGGNHSGTIDVTTNGDLTVTGANTTDRYAIIGHGDEPTDGDSGQTVSGDVLLRVGGNATLMNAFVGHQIDSDGVYDNGNTFLGVVGDLTADADSQFNSAPNNSPDGELRIYLGGDDLVDTATLMNGTAHGPLPFPNDQGDHVFGNGPYAPTSGNFAYYHIQQGLYNYTVDAAEAAAIVAALNLGDVTLASDLDQSAFGSFYDWDGGTQFIDINSDVAYDANQSFTLLATGPVNFNASVQNRNETGGDLNIVGGWELGTAFDATTFTAADVTSTTLFGNNMGSVFIGDGSQADGVAVGSRSGNTNVFAYDVNLQGGTGSATLGRFAQLGFQILNGVAWGGYDLDPTSADGANVIVDGGITVHSINNVTATGGNTSDYNYVQIGHVGAEQIYDASVEAAADSLIELTVGGNLSFTGGSRYAAYAQLGQSGFGADGDQSGMITITRANNLSFTGGSGFAAYAQLGQGGYSASGNHNGTTTITQANDLNFAGGGADYAYAQLGQGGSFAQGNHSGITTITQADDLIFTGGGSFATYAQLGQGGTFGLGTLSGMTTITQAVDLIFTGGGFAAYAQLGQGGADFTGDASGTLILSQANDLIFTGGSEDFTYAQLGQGGRYALGSHSGTTTIERANDLIFTGGTEFGATAQLGQGGYDADGSHSGTTTLTQANDLIFTGGAGDHTDAQLGQGGSFASGNHSGTTTITQANDLIFAGGSGFSASAQLGQGGYYAIGNHSGTTTITQANDLIFTGGTEFDASVQLGQGGYFAEGNHSGTTTITQANDLRFSGGSGAYTNVLFGQGGTDADGNHSGTTTIMQANDLIFAGGDGFRAYAQLGQGGMALPLITQRVTARRRGRNA